MKTLRIIFLLVMIFYSESCNDSNPTAPVASPIDDVSETVYRYLFAHNGSELQQSAGAYYLSFHNSGDTTFNSDLGNDFMSRFAGNSPPVKKVSQCTYSIYGVYDKEDGKRGLIFRIDTLMNISSSDATVKADYFEAGNGAAWYTLTLKFVQDKWQVVNVVLNGIS